ncbi:hypothetical protein VFPPC_16077 [Pochonia chlamydosporia 170]|uniref:Uncharacterized protein n=1 Tax=Pochonia chlamydosporia 170 TaxID=1380566 RepID=A0A179FPG6_METCM|nr:hypothetical protein VFPPC_16077 [Pochonia chlamydosporia 170]OAQ66899.1 hypothetical protein VFPPC_16077 [Pochonia chlamydosporia 170]
MTLAARDDLCPVALANMSYPDVSDKVLMVIVNSSITAFTPAHNHNFIQLQHGTTRAEFIHKVQPERLKRQPSFAEIVPNIEIVLALG